MSATIYSWRGPSCRVCSSSRHATEQCPHLEDANADATGDAMRGLAEDVLDIETKVDVTSRGPNITPAAQRVIE